MKTQARAVVIGGGVGGCSTLYHLTKLGWSDVVLVERDELTSGSTWHAAGQVTQFGTVQTMVRLKRYSTRLYAELAADPEHPINYHITGGVRLAHSSDDIDGYQHFIALAKGVGVDFELLSAEETGRRHPLISTDGLAGSLWDPVDGDIDPSQLTQALARRARQGGAEIYRFNPVIGIERKPSGDWRVRTEKGDIDCEVVVNATGYRVNEVGAMLGVEHPVVSMEHQYFLTESIPEIEALGHRVPIIRDPGDDFYSRQERQGLLVGIYEQACRTWGMEGIPDSFTMDLLPNDLDRLADNLEGVFGRLPVLAETGITRIVNGPITYSPDGLPLIGKIPGLHNAYACLGLRAGIGEGGGHGKCLAEIIVHGECEWEMWDLDPRRFTDFADQPYTAAKAIEEYQHEFVFHMPHEERPAGRPLKTTPLYETFAAKGAHFGLRGGWERALYFRPQDPDFVDVPSFRHTTWFDLVGAECRAVRERVGITETTGFTRLAVSGPDAAAFLDRMIAGRLPSVGRIGLGYFCSDSGGVVAEATVVRLAEDSFWLVSAAAAEHHDLQWLSEHLDGAEVAIENLTRRFSTLVVAGPRARDLLSKVTEAPLDNAAFPWLGTHRIELAGAEVQALRVNFVGELGWELHVAMEDLKACYEGLVAAGEAFGLAHFGAYAMESLRLEKCYRHWKADLTTEFSPLETGLDRFVKLDKGDFLGRAALLSQKQAGIETRFVPLIVDCKIASAQMGAPVWSGGQVVGSVSSGGYGHTIGKNIALGFLRADLAEPGTEVAVTILGEARPAVVAAEPLYDPRNERLKA